MDRITNRPWMRVAWSMRVGAIYDAGFALAILFFGQPVGRWMGLVLPADPVYLRLNGIFLILLAGFYALPATRPQRYQGVVAVAVLGRFLGFLYFGGVWLAGQPPAFLFLGLGDLAFSAIHGVLLLAARRDATDRG